MDYKKLISHINSKNWYRQGAAVKLLYISYPYDACSHFTVNGKQIPHYYFGYVGFLRNDFMSYYFTDETAGQVCNFYLDKQKSNYKFLLNLKNNWGKKLFNKVVSLSDKLNLADLSLLSTTTLIAEFNKFSKIYETAWRESIFLDAFDIHSEKIAEGVVEKYKLNIGKNDLQILTSASQRTLGRQAELELLKLLDVKSPSTKIKAYAEKWHWLQNDYAHIEKLGADYFWNKLRKLKNNKSLPAKEKTTLRQFDANLKLRKKMLQKIGWQSQAAAILEGLSTLSVWRDSRKALNQMASFTVKRLALEIAKRLKISLNDLEHLTYWEVARLSHSHRGSGKPHKTTKKNVISRKNGVLITDYPGRKIQIYPVTKNEWKIKALLDKLINRKGLKGSTAYPGMVRGKVKIMFSQKDFHKMKKGDILVAPNTRPEYVPIMKIAGAIISEEGGITCHSAIVSRELKIPCIVGVQGATDQLKDGDIIEVDANKGFITKL
jgi:phosphohistidine swiveling domain-containing protein